MNDLENRKLIMSNFYRAIAGTVEHLSDEALHAEHAGSVEEGYPVTDCTVCRREYPYWFAMLERKFGTAI